MFTSLTQSLFLDYGLCSIGIPLSCPSTWLQSPYPFVQLFPFYYEILVACPSLLAAQHHSSQFCYQSELERRHQLWRGVEIVTFQAVTLVEKGFHFTIWVDCIGVNPCSPHQILSLPVYETAKYESWFWNLLSLQWHKLSSPRPAFIYQFLVNGHASLWSAKILNL